MASSLVLLGANHKVAPIEIREKLAVPKSRLPEALERLNSCPEIRESYILSTCNRTEFYLVGDLKSAGETVREFLTGVQGISPGQLDSCLYQKLDDECVLHLFSVAAGIDSMVLGEVQILGQIRESFATASELGTVRTLLDNLLRRALEAGKRVRNETEISSNAASVSYAAVELAKRIFGEINKSMALVIGAGEMGELVARTLVDNGVKGSVFTNRTLAKSQELAAQFRGTAVPFEQISAELRHADIVISSTDAPHYVVTRTMVQEALHARRGRPLFLIDLAVPRDVEPSVDGLSNVYVYNVDDLQAVVSANLKEREKEVDKVKEIITQEVSKFGMWRSSLDVAPTITALRQQAEEIRLAEIAKIQSKLGKLSEAEQNAVNSLTLAIVNKMLHRPMTNLRTAASNGRGSDYVQAVQELFELKKE
ncbi:MAG: glutamyl-tRNA reductase [Dehalococcoidia bacterium]|nr:glutamyl-tRNA reductase [Dehalococcoidia bacterium]